MRRYNVIPRYTAGSPAMVDERTALRVAEEEKRFIRYYLEGGHGEEGKATAERLGLDCIALEDQSTYKHPRYRDVLTGLTWTDIPYVVLRADPETIVTRVGGGKCRYYYRRSLVFTGKASGEYDGKDCWSVLAAIARLHPGFDPVSQEASALWASRKRS